MNRKEVIELITRGIAREIEFRSSADYADNYAFLIPESNYSGVRYNDSVERTLNALMSEYKYHDVTDILDDIYRFGDVKHVINKGILLYDYELPVDSDIVFDSFPSDESEFQIVDSETLDYINSLSGEQLQSIAIDCDATFHLSESCGLLVYSYIPQWVTFYVSIDDAIDTIKNIKR